MQKQRRKAPFLLSAASQRAVGTGRVRGATGTDVIVNMPSVRSIGMAKSKMSTAAQ